MMNVLEWDKAAALLQPAQRVLILTHINPDGDAIGSMMGLAHVLRKIGKQVFCAVDGGTPADLLFLPGSDIVQSTLDGIAVDLVIVNDCSDERRIGNVGRAARALNVPFINVDHHRTNTMFGNANIVDISTVATAELVLNWLDQLGIMPSVESAQCLLTGIVTDTNCFRTDAVNAITLGKAERLISFGANLSAVVQKTVSRLAPGVLKLWSRIMPTLKVEDDVIWLKISRADFAAAGVADGEDGKIITLILQSEEVKAACVLTEESDGVDVGFRAKPGHDVSKLATYLGGGGHLLASGAFLRNATLDQAEARVIPLLKETVVSDKPSYLA